MSKRQFYSQEFKREAVSLVDTDMGGRWFSAAAVHAPQGQRVADSIERIDRTPP